MGGHVRSDTRPRTGNSIVNEPEAVTVRTIFNEFLRLGNVHSLQEWLREKTSRADVVTTFSRSAVHDAAHPHYIGLIKHKKGKYPRATCIIDRETGQGHRCSTTTFR